MKFNFLVDHNSQNLSTSPSAQKTTIGKLSLNNPGKKALLCSIFEWVQSIFRWTFNCSYLKRLSWVDNAVSFAKNVWMQGICQRQTLGYISRYWAVKLEKLEDSMYALQSSPICFGNLFNIVDGECVWWNLIQ